MGRMRTSLPALIAIAVLYVGVPLVLGGKNYVMTVIIASLIIGGLALSWALLNNLGGMVSFGHAAFFGVGAYTSALLTIKAGWPVFPAMLMGALAATMASLVMLPALRLREAFFALAILAYAEIFRILATQFESLTGGAGGLLSIASFPTLLGFDFSSKVGSYLIILAIVTLFVLVYWRLHKSDYGMALRAMHESQEAATVVGVNSTLLKGLMLMLAAFMAGLVGAFNAHFISFLDPDYAFSVNWSMLPIIAAIIGGQRTILGPIGGAVIVYLFDQLLLKSWLPTGHEMVLGALLAAVIILSPAGIWPLLTQRWRRSHHVAG